jgi:hypothetical protein
MYFTTTQKDQFTQFFFAASGVQSVQTTSGMFHFRRAAFSSGLKSKVGLALAKVATLCIPVLSVHHGLPI